MSEPSGALSNQGDVDVKDGCLFASEEMEDGKENRIYKSVRNTAWVL